MSLTRLIRRFEKCREELVAAVNRDAKFEDIQKIDGQLSELAAAIENLNLHQPIDIKKQIEFFLLQLETTDGAQRTNVNLQSVEKLVSRYADRLSTTGMKSDTKESVSSKLNITVNGQHFSGKELIEPAKSRVSLFNTEFQYQYTSLGNAKFYGTTPTDFVGKHVLEIIGKQRFAKRARSRMEECFSGVEQRYFHFLPDLAGGERLMDCQMTPYYDNDNCVRGAFVSVEDITDKLEGARRTSLQ